MAGEWIKCILADACRSIDYGLTASASEYEVGPKFLRITDIVNGHIDWNAVPHVAADEVTAAKYRLYDGDIVLARTGASTGASAYVKNPPPAVFASYLVRLQAKPEFDARFLAYYLRSDTFWTFIRGVLGDKSAQPNASASTMTKAPLRAPKDKNEQRAIAHILGTLDDKIELNRKMSETLEAMARALFKAWFVDFEPVRAKMEGRWQRGQSLPGLPAHLYDLFPDRLVDSELGEIPEGWEVATLGNVAENPRRSVQPYSIPPDTPYIALEHMPRRCIALSDWGTAEGIESNKFEFRKGEILFGKLRPYFHKVGVAPVDGVCSTDIVVVCPRTPHLFAFVLCVVSSDDFVEFTNAGSTGTKMPRTSWADMARYEIALPPDALAQAFNGIVRRQVDRLIAAVHESRTLVALRDALLPKLISGELRVKDVERFLEKASS
jgi:type I restriction enzyme S subunit